MTESVMKQLSALKDIIYIVLIFLTAGISWGVTRAEVSSLTHRVVELEKTNPAVLQNEVTHIKEDVTEIKDKLNKIYNKLFEK